jgi:exodeoxyribonuclease V alpha subunit
VPAYAATIHKSQGSEYPAVVIPVLTQHYSMPQRNLLYTGVTRGKRLVVLVGQKKASPSLCATCRDGGDGRN